MLPDDIDISLIARRVEVPLLINLLISENFETRIKEEPS